MVNLKVLHRSINFAGLKIDLPDNAELIFLELMVNAGLGAASMKVLDATQSKYVVRTSPSKEFHLLGLTVKTTDAAASTMWLYQGDTDGAITSLRIKLTTPTIGGIIEYACTRFPANNPNSGSTKWQAGKYVVFDPLVSNVVWVTAVGYEQDSGIT